MTSSRNTDILLEAEKCIRKADSFDLSHDQIDYAWEIFTTGSVNIINTCANKSDLRNFFRTLLNVMPLWESEPIISQFIIKNHVKLLHEWFLRLPDRRLIHCYDVIQTWSRYDIHIAEKICGVVISMFECLVNGSLMIDSSPVNDLDVVEVLATSTKNCENNTKSSKGTVLLINNYDYCDVKLFRHGHEKDSESLQKVAGKLNLAFHQIENASVNQLKENLTVFLNNIQIEINGLLIFAVCGHGCRDTITNTDFLMCPNVPRNDKTQNNSTNFSRIALNEILAIFDSCLHLFKVNKIFLFQCCRVLQTHENNSNLPEPATEMASKEPVHFPGIRPVLSARERAMVVFACLPGHLAYRSPAIGSFLLQDFCAILKSKTLKSSELLSQLRTKLQNRVENGDFESKGGIHLQPMYLVEQYIGAGSRDFQII